MVMTRRSDFNSYIQKQRRYGRAADQRARSASRPLRGGSANCTSNASDVEFRWEAYRSALRAQGSRPGRRRAPWIAQWSRMRPSLARSIRSGRGFREAAQAAAANEPVLAGTLHATILSQSKFEGALSYHLARLAGTTEVPAALLRQVFDEALSADPAIGLAAPGRHRCGRRPRSRLHIASRPIAVVQGLSRAADLARGPLAVEAGPSHARAFPAEPLECTVRRRHPSRRSDRQGNLHRPRHRAW